MIFFIVLSRSVHMITRLRRASCLVTIVSTLLASVTCATADNVSDALSAQAYFNRLDQWKKGSFTLADMQRIEGKEFERLDADHNGKLMLAEYVHDIPGDQSDVLRRFTRRFHLADKNLDGVVSYDEYMKFCNRVVELADANKDGVVTRAEFMAITGGGAQ